MAVLKLGCASASSDSLLNYWSTASISRRFWDRAWVRGLLPRSPGDSDAKWGLRTCEPIKSNWLKPTATVSRWQHRAQQDFVGVAFWKGLWEIGVWEMPLLWGTIVMARRILKTKGLTSNRNSCWGPTLGLLGEAKRSSAKRCAGSTIRSPCWRRYPVAAVRII